MVKKINHLWCVTVEGRLTLNVFFSKKEAFDMRWELNQNYQTPYKITKIVKLKISEVDDG
jgi:hypothetical protein